MGIASSCTTYDWEFQEMILYHLPKKTLVHSGKNHDMGVEPKIGVGPPNHPFGNRIFHYFHHPFWGPTPIFGKPWYHYFARGPGRHRPSRLGRLQVPPLRLPWKRAQGRAKPHLEGTKKPGGVFFVFFFWGGEFLMMFFFESWKHSIFLEKASCIVKFRCWIDHHCLWNVVRKPDFWAGHVGGWLVRTQPSDPKLLQANFGGVANHLLDKEAEKSGWLKYHRFVMIRLNDESCK